MNNNPILVNKIHKSFREKKALDNVSMVLKKGAITALLGENGAGKTSLLRIMLGFLKKDSGEVRISANRIGYVPENASYFDGWKGQEVLDLTCKYHHVDRKKKIDLFNHYSELLSFDSQQVKKPIASLSMGNIKKFSLLQNLLIQPDLFIFDEPFNFLDPGSIKGFRLILDELKAQGKSVLLSSHILAESEKISDEFIIINNGKIIIQSPLQSFLNRFRLFSAQNPEVNKEIALVGENVFVTNNNREILVECSKASRLLHELSKKNITLQEKALDLESAYFFFTGDIDTSSTSTFPL